MSDYIKVNPNYNRYQEYREAYDEMAESGYYRAEFGVPDIRLGNLDNHSVNNLAGGEDKYERIVFKLHPYKVMDQNFMRLLDDDELKTAFKIAMFDISNQNSTLSRYNNNWKNKAIILVSLTAPLLYRMHNEAAAGLIGFACLAACIYLAKSVDKDSLKKVGPTASLMTKEFLQGYILEEYVGLTERAEIYLDRKRGYGNEPQL